MSHGEAVHIWSRLMPVFFVGVSVHVQVKKLYQRNKGLSSDGAVQMYLKSAMQLPDYGHQGFEAQVLCVSVCVCVGVRVGVLTCVHVCVGIRVLVLCNTMYVSVNEQLTNGWDYCATVCAMHAGWPGAQNQHWDLFCWYVCQAL